MIFNEIKLVVNLGNDAEIKYLPSGTPVSTFSICHNEFKKNSNGEYEKSRSWWINCVIYGESAITNESVLKKGKKIAVTGKLTIDSWTSSDGKDHKMPKIIVNNIESIFGQTVMVNGA